MKLTDKYESTTLLNVQFKKKNNKTYWYNTQGNSSNHFNASTSSNPNQGNLMTTSQFHQLNSHQNSNISKIKCFYCKLMGHHIRDCWKHMAAE